MVKQTGFVRCGVCLLCGGVEFCSVRVWAQGAMGRSFFQQVTVSADVAKRR